MNEISNPGNLLELWFSSNFQDFMFIKFVITLFIENTFAGLKIPHVIYLYPGALHTAEILVLSLIFSLLSQIGDFLQSYIKRQLGIKDTGSLIPGHGGLFDRLDGLMFVAPIFALFIYYL